MGYKDEAAAPSSHGTYVFYEAECPECLHDRNHGSIKHYHRSDVWAWMWQECLNCGCSFSIRMLESRWQPRANQKRELIKAIEVAYGIDISGAVYGKGTK
jgi:hypothetical protein